MSEQEEPQQIGRLADEYARLKVEVQAVEFRVKQSHKAYLAAAVSFDQVVVRGDQLSLSGAEEPMNGTGSSLQYLLSSHELIRLFQERDRLRSELEDVRGKLRGWLTHV